MTAAWAWLRSSWTTVVTIVVIYLVLSFLLGCWVGAGIAKANGRK